LDLREWAPILRTPGVRFVDLQYGDTAQERAAVEAELGISLIHVPDLDLREDLDGVASLIGACDLVISISNTTVHLAAALGTPTWVLVPAAAGNLWYWMRDTDRSPWYASAVIVRQKVRGQWADIIQDVKGRLDTYLAQRGA
jgi:ADP-heptose:LPS heptosyltransferase